MKYFGAHVSSAGGLFNAPDHAAAIGATGFAMFTKNQRQWLAKPVTDDEATQFQEHCRQHGYTAEMVLPHDSYLINLGNPDAVKRANATDAFIAELQRVEKLGLKYLNFHPGSGLGSDPMETLEHIAAAIRMALDKTNTAVAVIENTAGQGTVAGKSIEELQVLIEKVDRPGRCGVCIDTCHAFAAGIDLASPEGYEAFWDEFSRRIGFEFLLGMHLNDAKAACGSHLDRHAPLGEGTIGWTLFERIAADSRIDGIPLVVETPDETKWPLEIAHLKNAQNT